MSEISSNYPPSQKSLRSFEDTDNMSPDLRRCVQEYGYAIVKACMFNGVTKASRIHQLVREIWDGARQPSQCRSRGGTIDWMLLQAGAEINAAMLSRLLKNAGMVAVPIEPTRRMLDASMAEVSQFKDRITKEEKHRRRLVAALLVGGDYLEYKNSAPKKTRETT